MNTTMESAEKKNKYSPCSVCRLFHDTTNGCQFVDKNKKKFRANQFLKHGNIRHILPSGDSVVSDYWIEKLKKYTFPALEITKESEKNKILAELKRAAEELPKVSEEERKEWNKKNRQMINVALESAEGHALVELQEQLALLTEQVKTMNKPNKNNKKSKRNRNKRSKAESRVEEDDSSSSSDSSVSADTDFSC